MEIPEDKLKQIANRLEQREQTDEDITVLCQWLRASNHQLSLQVGEYNVYIGEGQNIHIGHRTYNQWDKQAVQALMQSVEGNQQAIKDLLKELQKPKSKKQRSPAEENLRKQVGGSIGERLKELPYKVKLINLDKQCQQYLVKHPDNVELNSEYQRKIREDGNILNIFDDAQGQLLILGEPGSGKTTTMLVLAEALLERAEKQSDAPIPVLLKLSSFKKEEKNLFNWLLEELRKQYSCGLDKNIINKKVIKELLKGKKLLLMLDALDELEENNRKYCVEALNQLLRNREYVVCSRRQEYEILEFQLEMNRAICLQALSEAQIQEYLRDRQREEFWQTLKDQKELLNVLKRPLFLKIACDGMQEISINDWKNFTSLEERQLYLSRAYIRWCLRKEGKDSKLEKIRWLIWLAQQLQNHGQTEFFIERMQPSWLPPATLKWYVLLVRLSIILILLLLLMGGIYIDYIDSNFNSLKIVRYSIYIIGSLVTAVSASLHQKINLFEDNIVNAIFGKHNINLSNFPPTIVFVILFAVGLVIFLSLSTIPHYVVKLICIILFCGLLMVGMARLNGHELQQKTRPNQGIRNSAINAGCVAIPIAITVATGLSIKFPFKLFNLQFLSSLLMIGLPAGLICALLYGGLTCIQHFILRLILRCHGHPWNYAKFLDNAVEIKLLRRVGGRYEFIHSLLKECFAILPDM
ncbi:NACHT domain-containing protein [Microcoleus sp. F10-C6]|uniref:NACHT domain-containing protein n=1 Tax=unclassified Microcoleus TaxID=2642155 RepID=UPI002FD276C5